MFMQGGETVVIYRFDGPDMHDQYGSDVAGIGDVDADGIPDFMFGANNEDPGGILNAGSLFVHSGRTGSLIYRIDGRNEWAFLGVTMAEAGDVDVDGVDDFMVTTYLTPNGFGLVEIYSGATGLLIRAYDGQDIGLGYAASVDNAGDVNGDGYPDLIIGDGRATPGGLLQAGGVKVFSGFDGSLLHRIAGTKRKGHLGASVAGVGDVNGDGYDDFAAGTGDHYWYDRKAGSFFVYSGFDGSLLFSKNGRYGDSLGSALASAGDVNGDGTPDILVGASNAARNGHVGGAALVISGATFEFLHLLYSPENTGYSAKIGSVLASVGDADGDSIPDIIVGANEFYGSMNEPGSAYLFSGSTGALIHRWDGYEPDSYFGGDVDGVGDLDGDGLGDVIISALHESPNGVLAGGSVRVLAFHPFLTADTHFVSASSGGTLNFKHSFPDACAGYEYKTLISATGNQATLYGVEIPLALDYGMRQSFLGRYPSTSHSGMHGILDAAAQGSATIDIAGGMPIGFVGRSFWFAAIANQAGQLPEFSSIAVKIEIVP